MDCIGTVIFLYSHIGAAQYSTAQFYTMLYSVVDISNSPGCAYAIITPMYVAMVSPYIIDCSRL